MDANRVVLDSSKALKAIDELAEKVKVLEGLHGELGETLMTAYKNDNLKFYSKMAKQVAQYKEALAGVYATFKKVSEDAVEHSNRVNKIDEEY